MLLEERHMRAKKKPFATSMKDGVAAAYLFELGLRPRFGPLRR